MKKIITLLSLFTGFCFSSQAGQMALNESIRCHFNLASSSAITLSIVQTSEHFANASLSVRGEQKNYATCGFEKSSNAYECEELNNQFFFVKLVRDTAPYALVATEAFSEENPGNRYECEVPTILPAKKRR